ncbi:UDP-N-acetylmuramoyl-L-alanyl-D-glutamate--2,6-diaminopimelate ligase [Desulfosporosinus sp.]|uniref:UDP-N-acetylmuramoyl-L-alanyl-D-glutamate--2, 6-diaminopimelate ligase n=1 Tax=Desulfosporosinus sp. TaxID=157907 RepID=UPI0025BE4722|nr:UDP-N-acetylmuramoyl-L-alanyl-D-glutamate--2,6-diaminopimelate ligase [Desulfosporosinus sp.]MBC2721389.1 UDP-N-acetylmuramoyl-L-alanyl-D-glutamate--2,6-diaminopimelate ligase [Desulfosporosinus sp.]MBC2728092.1 UDP-N-acetylmuramoyl-L-alanyl-D-glutamate--2,6-diaminopimelate ligase [Desulfosporosinus sp.]
MPTANIVLKDIISGIEVQASTGDSNVIVRGMSMDSRLVQPGDLYACIPGFQVDGHDFAAAAVASGAVALVVERFLPIEVPQVKVSNVRQVVGKLAAMVYGNPSEQLELVGVTGTNGKTTITYLIEKIGIKNGKKVGLIGTLGSRIDGRSIPGDRTTPESIDVQKLLGEMVAEGVSLAVMEVSSHALSLGRVTGCEFDVGIFTNLTQDHLDYHKTMEDYLYAKSLLFANLKGSKQPKISILNGDDPAFRELSKASIAPVVSYGIHNNVDYRAENVEVTTEGVRFQVRYGEIIQDIWYATPGYFSVYNALAAFAWGVERGYLPATVAEALAEISGVPGRFESVRLGQPFQVIVDYAHTPDGLENVVRTARDFTKGRLITVFGCGGDRDRTKRPLMGEVAARGSDFLFVTSDNPRTEDPDQIIKEILTGVSGVDYIALADRREAIGRACQQAKPGDTILIAGKGHETYQIFGTEVHPFDDREVAREALRGLGYGQMDR